jgi:hypothetical protein
VPPPLQDRLTDHRVGITHHGLDEVMAGESGVLNIQWQAPATPGWACISVRKGCFAIHQVSGSGSLMACECVMLTLLLCTHHLLAGSHPGPLDAVHEALSAQEQAEALRALVEAGEELEQEDSHQGKAQH